MVDTLFAHMALAFGSHPENLATSALGYVLGRSSAARAGMQGLLRQMGVEVSPNLTWVTEVAGADDARPDLVGLDSNGHQPIIIEAKFWAGLTENQPLTYFGRPGLRALIFVAPAARSAHLWGELCRRCNTQRPLLARPTPVPDGFVADFGDHQLALLSWRALVTAMLAASEAANDRRAAEDLTQLFGLCERMDAEAFLPVTSDELTMHVYRRVIEFGAIVDDVVTVLSDRGVATTKNVRQSRGNGWYGRYLWLRGVGVLLLCDVRKWMKYAPTPLWLSVYGSNWQHSGPQAVREALASLETQQPPAAFIAMDGFPAVPLFVPVGAERDRVLQAVVEQVIAIGELVAPLGTATVSASAEPLPTDAEPSS